MSKPWEKKKFDTEELQWRALQIALAYGPLEPWEIPLMIFYEDGYKIMGLREYMKVYKAENS